MDFELWGKSYYVESHNQGYSGPSYLAASVKLYKFPSLDNVHQDRLDTMVDAGYVENGSIAEYAFQSLSESWWEDIRERAKSLGLGEVFSAGRSGGWLVLDDYSSSYFLELIERANGSECFNCGEMFVEHSKGKCLFGPTEYYGINSVKDMRRYRWEILKVIRFLRSCSRGVRLWSEQSLRDEQVFLIDQYWEEFTADQKSAESA
jgi:hypothetical protein